MRQVTRSKYYARSSVSQKLCCACNEFASALQLKERIPKKLANKIRKLLLETTEVWDLVKNTPVLPEEKYIAERRRICQKKVKRAQN